MKERSLTYLSLLVSLATLGYVGWVHKESEHVAMSALRRREFEFVTELAPKMRIVCADMGKTNAYPAEPKTLEELIRPLLTILDHLGELPHDNKEIGP